MEDRIDTCVQREIEKHGKIRDNAIRKADAVRDRTKPHCDLAGTVEDRALCRAGVDELHSKVTGAITTRYSLVVFQVAALAKVERAQNLKAKEKGDEQCDENCKPKHDYNDTSPLSCG